MHRIKTFAADHPAIFSLIVTLIYIIMLIISAILGSIWPGDETYGQPGGIAGRLLSIAILLLVVSGLGWLRPAGFASAGGWGMWLVVLLSLAYTIAASSYVMTGDFDGILNAPLTILVILFILAAAFMEQVVFRGVILHALIRAWGDTTPGVLLSVLLSSLLFSSIHLLDFLGGRSPTDVLLQSLEVFFLGIFLGTLVLSSKSIYPATIFHGILNLSAYVIIAGTGSEPSASVWLLLSLVMVPLAVYSIYLLRGVSMQSIVPENASL